VVRSPLECCPTMTVFCLGTALGSVRSDSRTVLIGSFRNVGSAEASGEHTRPACGVGRLVKQAFRRDAGNGTRGPARSPESTKTPIEAFFSLHAEARPPEWLG
jgi:hypothetical protein